MKPWLPVNDIEIYSWQKSVVAERFTKTLKENLQTYVCSIRNVYIKKLDEIFDKYINTWLRITKMKHVYVKSGTNIDFDVGNSDKDTRFRSTVSRPCI